MDMEKVFFIGFAKTGTISLIEVMADIFSIQWMQKMMDEWNKEPELANELSNLGFNSTIH